MGNNTLASRLLSRGRVAKLDKGIHENVVISKIDPLDRKKNGMPTSKTMFITFTAVDPKTNKRKAAVEVSWWKLSPDPSKKEYLFENMREFCIQLQGILTSYMTEDEAFEAMETVFKDWDFKVVKDIEEHTWKKADLDLLTNNIKTLFAGAMKPFVGEDKQKIRVKISTDKTGMYSELPRYGRFTESMDAETTLKFTDAEKRMHSNVGTVTNKAEDSGIDSL